MKNGFAALIVALFVVATGISWSQETIPPRTLTKKRVTIQNIHKCEPGRTTLVGRGNWDPIKKKHPRYVCRPRTKQQPIKQVPIPCPDPTGCSHTFRDEG